MSNTQGSNDSSNDLKGQGWVSTTTAPIATTLVSGSRTELSKSNMSSVQKPTQQVSSQRIVRRTSGKNPESRSGVVSQQRTMENEQSSLFVENLGIQHESSFNENLDEFNRLQFSTGDHHNNST